MEIKKVWSVNCLLFDRPSKEGTPLDGHSSCVGGLKSLLNTEGILTLPVSVEWRIFDMNVKWFFAQWCRVLLSLSIFMKSLSSTFGWFVEMWLFLMALVVWFLWSETFFQGPVDFTYVVSCAVVGWAFPVVDYISFLSIWNWIFWMHE